LHGAMKHVAAARKQMGIRTIFNMLGPLTNPAGANAQLVGVYSARLTEVVAGVLRNLGVQRALVVHGSDGMDEVTITTSTKVTELFQGELTSYFISPEEYGLPLATLEEIRGGTLEENARLILIVLNGQKGPHRDIVLLNAAAALVAASRASSLHEGIEMSSASIDSGLALSKLTGLIEFTNSF
jgi:anthranilate phosphoribosyltransferase